VNTEARSREDFEQAQSTVARLEAGRTNAQKTLEDLALGTRSEKIQAQESIIASLHESTLASQVDLKHSEIRSPYDGIIIERLLHEGSVTSPGITVFVISEAAHLEAHFGVPPQMIASLQVGQQLNLFVRGVQVEARLKSIVPQVDDETRTLKVIASISHSNEVRVLAGDGAKIVLTRPQNVEGIWLRTACILQGQRGLWECFVAEKVPDSDTRIISRRSIEILHTEGDRVLVRGAIHDGDWVVSSAVNRVVVGQVVQATERVME
jgi:RND family efflux transporter MFP subunit